jgi:tRNA-dihydrouridine synthase
MFHDRQSGGKKQGLHNVLVHARSRAQHARTHIRDVSQFEQTLNGSVFAEGAVQHGKDHIDVDGAVAGAARERGVGLKRDEPALPLHGLRRHHHGFSPGQHRRGRGGFRIARAQVARLEHQLALQQVLGVIRSQPATVFRDADGHDLVPVFVDRF